MNILNNLSIFNGNILIVVGEIVSPIVITGKCSFEHSDWVVKVI